ncbi:MULTISPECIES: BLUF domain-containing protein [unclassified Acinetobacter]|uniref:BLUF domain-containing protein n=1 Tax=unclassified Acinetobacter TaxID=196816 RepID=UPI001C23F5FF|nr:MULTISPECIES: BLUF domain-containing protein [unclassified Acinetobacter]
MMLQLCYASERIESEQDLLQELSDILTTARNFNQQHQIHDVLYYSHGKFFQCLEGQAEVVENLFQSISRDARHHKILRFKDTIVEQSHFSKWSMKYVHKHSEISSLFSRLGWAQFEPHALQPLQLAEFLKILYRLEENQASLASPKGYKQRGYIPYF